MRYFVLIALLCVILVSYVAVPPASAQVELPVKSSSRIASGKFLRFLPLALIHKDDTFVNSPSKKGEVPRTFLLIQPVRFRLRDGSRYERLMLNVGGQVTEGPSVDETIFLTVSDAELLLTRLNDARRIIKRWDALKDSMSDAEKTRAVAFNPHPNIQVRAEMAQDQTIVYALKINNIISIGFIGELSETINQVEVSTKWLKTGKLPK